MRPEARAVLRQNWRDLLFLHWRVSPEVVRNHIPQGLDLDLWGGSAWIGLVPFRMEKVRPAGFLSFPWISKFLELNLRTYVRGPSGLPGVWFFSLECERLPAVWIARTFFHLNYQAARMSFQQMNSLIDYRCQRFGKSECARYSWRAPGQARPSAPGSLEEFLVERYLLYSVNRAGRLHGGAVYHKPYQIASVEVLHADPAPFSWNGLPIPKGPPDHVVASAGVDVEVFPLCPVH